MFRYSYFAGYVFRLAPASNCFSAPIICASVCLLFDIFLPPFVRNHTRTCSEIREQVNRKDDLRNACSRVPGITLPRCCPRCFDALANPPVNAYNNNKTFCERCQLCQYDFELPFGDHFNYGSFLFPIAD